MAIRGYVKPEIKLINDENENRLVIYNQKLPDILLNVFKKIFNMFQMI